MVAKNLPTHGPTFPLQHGSGWRGDSFSLQTGCFSSFFIRDDIIVELHVISLYVQDCHMPRGQETPLLSMLVLFDVKTSKSNTRSACHALCLPPGELGDLDQ